MVIDDSDAQCPNMKFAAAQHKDGTLQGFYKLPADLCYKLPDVSSPQTLLRCSLIPAVTVSRRGCSRQSRH